MPFIEAWEAKWDPDYYCLYVSVFFLPAGAFLCLFVGLESRLFLLLSVILYYSLIEKNDLRHVPIYTFYLFFYFRVTSNSILFYSPLFCFKVTSNCIPPLSFLFHFKVTSNFIPPCIQQSKTYSIFDLVAIDDIFFVGAINKVNNPIAKHVR